MGERDVQTVDEDQIKANYENDVNSSPLVIEEINGDSEKTQLTAGTDIEANQLTVTRLAYNLPKFNEQFVVQRQQKRSPSDVGNKARLIVKSCCTLSSTKARLVTLFPILNWLINYQKSDFIADVIAGITIVIFQVPQSMGYCLIARVPAVNGLYTSFFPPLIYSLMGTSKHCAIVSFRKLMTTCANNYLLRKRTFAVVSLMTGSLITQVNDERKLWSLEEVNPIQIAVVVSFLIGIYKLIFGILRLGFVSVYMSEQLISGFTTAASVYVFTSQLPYLTGIQLHHASGPLALINIYIDLFRHISTISYLTLCISVTCCIILFIFKFYTNNFIRKKFNINVPFPIELLLVIIATLCSAIFDTEKNWKIKNVGPIPRGLPSPSLPTWSLFGELALKSIPLAIVSFSLTISVGKIFANRHNYSIDANQELIALGSTNIISSFFTCIPSAASLSRSAVQESAGGRTQLVSLVNCVGLLFVIYYAGSLLEKLPICILAAIIVVALKSLLIQVKDFCRYWRVSKIDGSIWLITFFAVILLDVDIGLYVGLCYSLVTLIYKSQRPKMYLLGCVNKSDVFVPLKKYGSSKELENIKIFQFCGPLHFANTEYFKNGLQRKIGVNVKLILSLQEKDRKTRIKKEKNEEQSNGRFTTRRFEVFACDAIDEDNNKEVLPTHIIIDCSMFSYIDASGVRQLKATVQEYESIGIKTYLASVATHVDHMLEKDNFYTDVPPQHVYISIIDAVHHAIDDQKGFESKKSSECSLHVQTNSSLSDVTVDARNCFGHTSSDNS
ncbi:solute carrier family 26 member 6-like protein [Leptotrombidium deliense]|uniref:Solute carrier family 26 member 6-like protein n=1 Tax=Leptotrombidium deliense TaxID=299467 RepID=A0A443SVY6_9ACAR|nr:solute carrier family 26 member 6-like protein [Leptotrombidium deliense]